MTDALISGLTEALIGRKCVVQKRDADWSFDFGEHLAIAVSVPWRIVTPERIVHGDEDDGQWFGLPKPVNGEEKANDWLRGRAVISVEVDELTADLRIAFDGGCRLDLFNNSSGYEGWQAYLSPTGAESLTVVAMGGGGFTSYRE